MAKRIMQRKSCKDVFNAFLIENAEYSGYLEFPNIRGTNEIPNRVIVFSKAISCKDYNQWVHFYEYDYLFERLWKNPKRYLKILKKYNGVILPDFSLYRDMPLVMQLWNIFRSRALGEYFQKNGINIIPNLRFGDKRTFDLCCCGIEQNCVIAVGAVGNIKKKLDREIFLQGFDNVIKKLHPSAVVVYGSIPEKYLSKYKDVRIIQFNSDTANFNREVV